MKLKHNVDLQPVHFQSQSTIVYLSVWFGLVVFLGHINPCGVLISNSGFTYTHNLETNSLLVTPFLIEPELIYLHTVKWFQVLLSNTNNSS